jgi:hypothetical protein
MGGAASGSGYAIQYIYTQTIIVAHPNNDRISIFGAPMLAPVPRNDSGYAWNGSSTAQRATDMTTNLNMLRTKFATELHFQGNIATSNYPLAGIQILGKALMHLDALLFTGDGSAQGEGVLFNCIGYTNNLPKSIQPASPFSYDGLAAVNWKGGAGFNWDVGACMGVEGVNGQDQNTSPPFIAIGCNSGIALTNGGFVTCSGNAICLGNDTSGFYLWPRSGTQWDGGLFCNANAGQGIQCYLSSTGYLAAPLNLGAYNVGPSHCYRNGGYGLWLEMANISANIDFGAGANGNNAGSGGGQIYAGNNSGVQLWGAYANYTPCTPAFGTNGNNNSMINVGW